MATVYTVSEIARLLGVSVATVRRIADDMAEILPDYQPASGQARKLSQADVLTISALWARLQADTSLTRSTLLAELSAPGSEPLIIPDTLPTPETDTPQNARREPIADRAIQTDVASPQNAIAPFLQAHADTQRQIEKLSAQLAEIRQERPQERQAERRYPTAVIICFVLLLTGVTFSALLSDSRAALAMSFVALVVIAVTLIWPQVRR
jgi:hypothetical protein